MRMPRRQIVCADFAPGQRAEITEQDDHGKAQCGHRADQRTADQGAAADAALRPALPHDRDRFGALLVGRAGRVPFLDDLVVVHEPAGPLDRAQTDQQQGEAQSAAEGEVGGAEADEHRVPGYRQVGDDERDREHGREAEHRSDLAFGPLRRLLVHIGEAWLVRRDPGVGNRVARAGRLGDGKLAARAEVAAHGACAPLWLPVSFTPLAAIHTAMMTRTPMPMIQAARPSGTGPSPPRLKPPRLGSFSIVSR